MKRKATLFLAGLAAAVTMGATTASAAPITLFDDGTITKMKFTNFENVFQGTNPGNDPLTIDTGDYFEGILQVTDIGSIPAPTALSGQLSSVELTGHFRISVVSGLLPMTLGAAGHLDLALLSGDFINLYYDAAMDWDPTSGTLGVAEATNGNLWVSLGNYEGVNDTTTATPFTPATSINRNWADVAVNNTGYTFIPTLFGIPTGEPVVHYKDLDNSGSFTAGDVLHGDHLVDVFFASRLFTPSGIAGYAFRSEDPVYVNAVPEPGTFLLFGSGLVGLGLAARRRFKK